jgi:hypothetical protein
MKLFESTELFVSPARRIKPVGTHDLVSAGHNEIAKQIVETLLEQKPLPPPPLLEATVHRARRSRVWVATFTGAAGGQVWKSTGLTDYDQALLLARYWESQARTQRAKLGLRKPSIPVRPKKPGTGMLTQREVAQVLHMSERGVREVERRALSKLRQHPLLKELWDDYSKGVVDEACWTLNPAEIEALFDLAGTLEELRLVEKVLRIIQ